MELIPCDVEALHLGFADFDALPDGTRQQPGRKRLIDIPGTFCR
jgi:hypothetical protein